MSDQRLKADERVFLAALVDVVFGNPYTPERAKLIQRLAPGTVPANREALAQVVVNKLGDVLRQVPAVLQRLAGEDRALLETALLYVTYHRHVPQIDAHIERQANTAGEALAVDFGKEVVGELVRSGFDEQRALHYFALYFQLRRAYYFIERSLAGDCESMRRMRESLWKNVFTHDMRAYDAGLLNRMEDFSTLLLGETGTGKGNAAATIGRSEFIPYLPEKRRFAANFAESFIAINLSQFSETLIESELFGHRKGAFTGAIDHHEGVFGRCNAHGALFLDEIGEVSIPVQIKLLQVLQERSFTPVGGRDKQRFSGRVIAATNRSLDALRRGGRFREDFFYRLCSDVIEVPTLRQRIAESPAELELLVGLLVARIAGMEDKEVAAGVLEALHRDLPRDYPWPGNVRELEQAVRRILLTGSYRPELASPASQDGEERLIARLRTGELSAEALLSGYSAMLYERLGSYAAVAERTQLDPRTSRKYVLSAKSG
jgi:transcriptional regulator with AAA-type ATPase domain